MRTFTFKEVLVGARPLVEAGVNGGFLCLCILEYIYRQTPVKFSKGASDCNIQRLTLEAYCKRDEAAEPHIENVMARIAPWFSFGGKLRAEHPDMGDDEVKALRLKWIDEMISEEVA